MIIARILLADLRWLKPKFVLVTNGSRARTMKYRGRKPCREGLLNDAAQLCTLALGARSRAMISIYVLAITK